jgi:type IV pilus assembly protein PilQ
VTVAGADAVTVAGASGESSVAESPAAESPSDGNGDGLVVMNGANRIESPNGDGTLVSMAFEEETLPNVVKAFRDATGANIISAWTNTTPRLVSMRLENVEWRMGLNALVASYGLELKEEPRESNIYVVREKVTTESEQPRFAETFVLKHAKAEEVSSILQYALGFSAPAVEATNKLAKAKTAAETDPKSVTVAFPSANIVVVKATEEQLKAARSIIDTLDVPTRQVYIEARFVRLSSSASKKLGMKWDSLDEFGARLALGGGFQVSDGNIATYDMTSKSASRVTKVSKAGVKTKSAWDETKTTSTLLPESMSTDLTGATISGLTADDLHWKKASAFGGVLSMSELGLTLSAFEETGGAQLFSNPRIIVQNETTAKVDMTVKEPNVNIEVTSGTTDSPGDKISSMLSTIPGKNESWVGEAFFSYGITLEVTPRVSSTGLITVEIVPSISSLDFDSGDGGYRFIGAVEGAQNQFPIIRMQRLETTFTMADGKTAVIGGLTETTESNTDSGIPLLRKIPWVGPRLFGWKSRQKDQFEIIVFVTVGIIDGTTIQQDAGMPKNAVLGRGLFDGSVKEPGDRSDEEMFDLEHKPAKGYRIK